MANTHSKTRRVAKKRRKTKKTTASRRRRLPYLPPEIRQMIFRFYVSSQPPAIIHLQFSNGPFRFRYKPDLFLSTSPETRAAYLEQYICTHEHWRPMYYRPSIDIIYLDRKTSHSWSDTHPWTYHAHWADFSKMHLSRDTQNIAFELHPNYYDASDYNISWSVPARGIMDILDLKKLYIVVDPADKKTMSAGLEVEFREFEWGRIHAAVGRIFWLNDVFKPHPMWEVVLADYPGTSVSAEWLRKYRARFASSP